MADFRGDVYAKYVSSFKGGAATRDERALRYYLRWCEIKYGPFLKALPPGGRVLDLGCGSGDVMRLLVRRGFDAEGIDISEEQISLAVAAGLNAQTADAFEFLASRQQTYDGIVAVDFIEHFAKEELLRLLAAIRAALKPGGWLLIQTPNGQGLFANTVVYGDLSHLTILTPRSLRQALALGGFENVDVYEAGPAPLGVGGTLRSAVWPVLRGAGRLVRAVETSRVTSVLTENMISVAQATGADGQA